jgi:hypothetical protein
MVQDAKSRSEVIHLKEQIAAEYQAAKPSLEGLAVAAQHKFLIARMEDLALIHEQLGKHTELYEAVKIMTETLEHL